MAIPAVRIRGKPSARLGDESWTSQLVLEQLADCDARR
jgi:hypothetical protein